MGDDGFDDPRGELRPFGAIYLFIGRKWGITVWARNWEEAERHCASHGMRMDGEILERFDAEI
jgi:hypothetical protein